MYNEVTIYELNFLMQNYGKKIKRSTKILPLVFFLVMGIFKQQRQANSSNISNTNQMRLLICVKVSPWCLCFLHET